MNDEKYFIRNLKNYMTENKLSQTEMGRKMSVAQATINNIVNEKFKISMHIVHKFCEVSGMTIAQAFSPDPKQFGGAVEGDVQDGNAVAMMELMKKQMEELKEKNKKLEEVEESLRKRIKELQEENEAILKHRNIITDHNVSLRQENTKLREENEDLANRLVEYEKEFTALVQENLRLVSEGYNAKNTEPAEVDNLTLHVNTMESGRDYMYADLGRISVEEVVSVSPLDKKVTLTLYFDEIHIK